MDEEIQIINEKTKKEKIKKFKLYVEQILKMNLSITKMEEFFNLY